MRLLRACFQHASNSLNYCRQAVGIRRNAAGLAGSVLLGMLSVGAAEASSMITGPSTLGPPAAVRFCQQSPRECSPRGPNLRAVPLTPTRWQELQDVNNAVNASVAERSDAEVFGQEDVWSLPVNGQGDCEDFALLKRRQLIERGWPSSALLVTVVTTWSGEGHAVLTVVTDQGDFVLDNRTSSVRPWSSTGYRFFTRQAQGNPRRWVWIEPGAGRAPVTAASGPASKASR